MSDATDRKQNLVFLPGLLCDERFWQPQVDSLEEELPGRFRTSIVSLASAKTFGEIADEILEHAPERFGLIGHSLGGYIALEIMARAPERISCLVLTNSSAFVDKPEGKSARLKMIDVVSTGKFEAVYNRIVMALAPDGSSEDSEIKLKMLDMARDYQAERFINHQTAIIGRPDRADELGSIACPTLVVSGKRDPVTRPSASAFIHYAINGSSLVEVDAGHMAPLEAAEDFSAALIAFLKTAYVTAGADG